MVDFSASWCGPCKFIEPAIHAMAEKYTDVDFVKIDVDELSVIFAYVFFFLCFIDSNCCFREWFWTLFFFFSELDGLGCGGGVSGAGDADVRVVEEREGNWQGCWRKEGRAREEDWEASIVILALQSYLSSYVFFFSRKENKLKVFFMMIMVDM